MNPVQGELKVTHIFESLDKIASKIGLTVEQLWPYLVKQVNNEAMLGTIAICMFLLIAIFILFRFGDLGFSKWSVKEEEDGNYVIKDYQKVCTVIPLIIMVVLSMVFLFEVLPQFLNAEYFAFQDLMMMLKGR